MRDGRVLNSWLGALAGAGVGALVAGCVEARGAGEAGGSLWVAAGLLGLPALLMGCGVGVLGLLLHPRGLEPLLERCRRDSVARYAVLCAGPSAVLFLFLVARAALGALTAEEPTRAAGAVMAASAAFFAGSLVLLNRAVARALAARWPAPALGWAAPLSLALFVLPLALLISAGQTSGGGASWQIFGVLRREELNLRPVFSLGLIAACSYGAALLGSRARLPMPAALLLAALALAPLAGLPAARAMTTSASAEWLRAPGVVPRLITAAQRLSDGDGDGFSGSFGGGDCDDDDRAIAPSSDDVPGNGIDEDCTGRDASAVDLKPAPAPAPATAQEWIEQHLPAKPNIVLITVDTLRWDLHYAGNPRPLSPHLDALAARSTAFEHAYSLASYTSKSLVPMLIGKFPSEAKRDWSHFDSYPTDELFVQERLQTAGFRTLSVQGYWYFFRKGYGMERGFDVIDTSAAPKVIKIEGDGSSNGDELTDAALAQLRDPQLDEQQFYFWMHFVDPHSEYVRHEKHDFGADERARYDSEVAFVDEQIGRVLDLIQSRPFGERTLIFFTSDHGEAFGEHGMIRHGFHVWDELVRVPMIIHVPGAAPRRLAERRSILDIVPTMLDAARLPIPRDDPKNWVRGQSLLADVMGPPGHVPEERPVLVDMPKAPNNAQRQAFYDGRYKVIASEGLILGVYDVVEDPGERKDLRDDQARVAPVIDRYKAYIRQIKTFTPKR